MLEKAFPIIKNVYEDKNNQFERIVVPFTDGVKSLSVVTDLKKHTILKETTYCRFRKTSTLSIVDEAWKKRTLIIESVQLAVHNKRILIYKFRPSFIHIFEWC
jgi:preprotein translocase subunit SecA